MGALTLVTAVLGAAEAAAAARAESQTASFDAAMAQRQAEREQQIAARDAADHRRAGSRRRAALRARRAARGVTAEGSPLLAEEAAAAEIELGARNLLNQGAERAFQYRRQAALARARAGEARRRGVLRSGRTLLTGLGSAAYGGSGLVV